jgi:hypothetical protein
MTKSPKQKAAKINKGTLVAIPAGNEKFVLSQVYYPGTTFYLIAYKGLWGIRELLLAPRLEPILASWTNDAEIYRGRWIVVGEAPFEVPVPEPEYRVLIGGEEMVESFDGKFRRYPRSLDRMLKNRKTRSPLLLEDAARAFYGLGDRPPSYDDMLVESPSL